MPTLNPQALTSTGVALTFNTATAGAGVDRVPPGSILVVKNASGSPITVNLVTPLTLDGDLTVLDRTSASVAATTGINGIRVPNNEVFRDPTDGLVGLTWSSITSVTFAVVS